MSEPAEALLGDVDLSSSVVLEDMTPPPSVPESLHDAGLDEAFVSDLLLKMLHVQGDQQGAELARRVCLPFGVIEGPLQHLKDRLLVEISPNGDAGPWTEIALHNTSGGTTWRHKEITPAEVDAAGVIPTSTMKIRFTINDDDPQSNVEGGIDGFRVGGFDCQDQCPSDVTGNGVVDIQDFLGLLAAWGAPGGPADVNNDGVVDIQDFLQLLAEWGVCP